ncbi:MAG: hypothetical protein IJ960_00345 [Oscillospiraceae bacterium]|nr:hypothetical protein [Oscillospiraceae bacterium]
MGDTKLPHKLQFDYHPILLPTGAVFDGAGFLVRKQIAQVQKTTVIFGYFDEWFFLPALEKRYACVTAQLLS